MVEAVITLLKQRYIISTISYEGIQRIEKPKYPDAAIREAILNAIVHKDYTDSTIQMSIYDDKIILWNPGKLSEDLTIEKLKSKHPSRARNKNIAEVFFKDLDNLILEQHQILINNVTNKVCKLYCTMKLVSNS